MVKDRDRDLDGQVLAEIPNLEGRVPLGERPLPTFRTPWAS
jgi:hypothetical protein